MTNYECGREIFLSWPKLVPFFFSPFPRHFCMYYLTGKHCGWVARASAWCCTRFSYRAFICYSPQIGTRFFWPSWSMTLTLSLLVFIQKLSSKWNMFFQFIHFIAVNSENKVVNVSELVIFFSLLIVVKRQHSFIFVGSLQNFLNKTRDDISFFFPLSFFLHFSIKLLLYSSYLIDIHL